MADRIADWTAVLDAVYPPGDAEGWDRVGLQVGDPGDPVERILVCLDVTGDTLDEAVERDAQLVVAHHPLLFRALDRLTPASAPGRLALRAARAGLAVAAAHTNFDAAPEGTTAPVMALLGLATCEPLVAAAPGPAPVKVVVFVPVEATAAVLGAAFAAGAGSIGEYDECSFRVGGTGTFRPSSAANPAIGAREQRNDVFEDRVEIVVPRDRLTPVVAAIRSAHPYEEVALDVYPTIAVHASAPDKGLGRIAELPEPRTVGEIAARLRTGLPSPSLRIAGDPQRRVLRVAACGGAGDSLIPTAITRGAQLYITGDLRHHVALDALAMGLSLIDAGHYATEAPAIGAFIRHLERAASSRGLTARLLPSAISTDPWSAPEEERPG